MRRKLIQTRYIVIVFVYFLAATLTFIDKLQFIDSFNLGINVKYWGSNTGFLSSVAFWFNMFLFSILPVIIAKLIVRDKVITFCTYALPVYWGFILYLSINAAHSTAGVMNLDIKYFVYGFLFISAVIILTKLILLYRSLKTEQTLDELERFKKRATQKLEKLNPELNQNLFDEVLGNHGEALKLLIAATYEDDPQQMNILTRMALDSVAGEKDSLKKLQKRLTLYSTIAMVEN